MVVPSTHRTKRLTRGRLGCTDDESASRGPASSPEHAVRRPASPGTCPRDPAAGTATEYEPRREISVQPDGRKRDRAGAGAPQRRVPVRGDRGRCVDRRGAARTGDGQRDHGSHDDVSVASPTMTRSPNIGGGSVPPLLGAVPAAGWTASSFAARHRSRTTIWREANGPTPGARQYLWSTRATTSGAPGAAPVARDMAPTNNDGRDL
jgi:hypothetical protein